MKKILTGFFKRMSKAMTFTTKAYANPVSGDTTPPRILLPNVNGNVLWLIYSEPLDPTSVPAGTDFTVWRGYFTTQVPVVNVTIADNIIILTLGATFNAGNLIYASYKPGSVPIRDLAGNNITVAFNNQFGFNSTGGSVPLLLTLPTVKGNVLQLIYHEPLDTTSVPAGSAFTVKINGTAQAAPTYVSIAGSIITITLAAAVKAGDSVTVGYKPGSSPIRYAAGYNAGPMTNMLTINITPVDNNPPVLNEATVTDATISLLYSELLNAASVPAGNAFAIKVNGTAQAVPLNVAVVDSTVTLTLASAVRAGDLVSISYTPGSNPIRDMAGNNAVALTDQLVTNNTEGLVVPPIDPTVATSVYASTAFLYTGDNPVQTGMVPETIELKRAAVLRGKVLDREGTPIAGVEITIPGHPEFGRTQTQADGYFDMAVNGGGLLTVNYSKDNYLPVHRQTNVPWLDFALLPDVVMLQYDSNATAIDLTASVMQVAQGGQIADEDGTRRAVLLIPTGTIAEMTLPDGTTQSLTNMIVRATEYTVGASGPAAMPGELPPQIGYTYAVEYSVDQAVAAGAKDVRFNQPLFHYVENFLNFPVGEIVPVGYYNRDKAAWIPSDNGKIVKVLSITNGLAALDIDGSGAAADASALAALGVVDAERQQLALKYQAGQSLWRVPITHFTPWDCNWPFGPAGDAEAPNSGEPNGDTEDESCEYPGSIIYIQNQGLGEVKGIIGTPFSLNYTSQRSSAYVPNYSIVIPLSRETIPATLKTMQLEITIAGRLFTQEFLAQPNKSYTFIWDGKDVYGRVVQGVQRVQIKIGYTYQAVYQSSSSAMAQSFGRFSGVPITGSASRLDFTLWNSYTRVLGCWNSLSQGLGGWTLNEQHGYDPYHQELYLGDSSRRSAQSVLRSIATVAGNGTTGFSGDGGPATEAQFNEIGGLAIAPDGSVYIADGMNGRIRLISPDGIITTVAGSEGGPGPLLLALDVSAHSSLSAAEETTDDIGDGGAATEARLSYPRGLDLGSDGSLYIADFGDNRIRRVGPDGIITTVAGNGEGGYSGDEGLATAAQLSLPTDVAVTAEGSLYIADNSNDCIRLVDSTGIITTVAGNGIMGYSGDGGQARAAQLSGPRAVAIGPDGSIYIADTGNYRIRRIGSDGIITTVAGNGTEGFSGDGGPATAAQIKPSDISFGADGGLYIADASNERIRRVGTDGVITTVVGNGTEGYSGDGGPAAAAQLNNPAWLAIGFDGSIHITDSYNECVRRVQFALPKVNIGETFVPDEDGDEIYVFDTGGRHLRTINSLNGATIYQFAYDSRAQLSSITDGDGNITNIERDTGGTLTSILAPGGLRTGLSVNADGYLQGITCPMGKTTQLTYTTDGLLTSLTDHKGNIHHYTYDSMGRLIKDEDPAGGFTELSRTEEANKYTVAAASALGRTATYTTEKMSTGVIRRKNIGPTGAEIVSERGTDGITTVTYSDGAIVTAVQGADPRWGMMAPLLSSTNKTPAGLQLVTNQSGTVTYDPVDFTKMKTLTYSTSVNGRTYTKTYDADLNQLTSSTPMGLKLVATLDAQCRSVQDKIDGIDPVNYTYDSRGNLTTVSQGDQSVTYVHDSKNRVISATDVGGNQEQYEYNDANKVTKVIAANGSSYQYAYDANGNCIQITMPSGAVHNLDYTVLNQDASYTPPDNGAYAASYDLDKSPIRTLLPGGRAVDISYDTGGRPTGISYDAASVALQYADVTSRVSSITRTPTDSSTTQTMSFNYDGSLVTQITTSGLVDSQYSYRYNNDFAQVGRTLDNGPETVFTRNEDGRLTGYGPFTITRNGPVGAPDSVSDGVLNTTLGYDSKGRLVDRSHMVNGQQEYRLQLSYNNIGKIIQKTENIGGVVNTYAYTYDAVGQLTEVKKNGVVVETYTYDLNGNRTSRQVGISTAEIASYDAQDRLVTLGNINYQFDADGFLTQRGNDTFQYSAAGELLKATLASGNEITYIYDGMNRRIGRAANGQTHKYLYGNLKNPYQITATIEPDGTISSYHYDGAGLLFAIERNSTRYYVATDQVGSPKVVSAANGVVVKTLNFDSFGNLLSDSNPGFYLLIGFAGGIADVDTGLVRFGMRDYDPVAGRWTARDPIFFDGGQANLYGYCGSDPVKSRDPSGLRLPDFVSINVNVAIPTPWTGTLVGVTGVLSLDRNGNWYGGLGPNVGKAATILSGSATAGWLNQCGKPSEDKLKNFLSGHGVNFGAGLWGGGGITWSPGNGTATNVGLLSPQGGAGYTYSWHLGQSNISW